MPRALYRLSALNVDRLKVPGYHHDGGGLYLRVSPTGSKSWILRYSLAGRRPEMGLGPFPDVSLAAARKAAQDARALVKAGHDPIATRDAVIERQRLERARALTFDEAADQYITAHENAKKWRNAKHRQQWRNTLKTYASPVIGSASVADITTADITRILDPIWTTKPETASRLRGRIERIMGWATVRGYRTGDNPARWLGHLKEAYADRSAKRSVKHHAAVAIDALPATYARLRQSAGMAALAVRFVILTAARAGEVAGATWSEIDLEANVWTIPAERMKANREHRVPLSVEAQEILRIRAQTKVGELVFPGWKTGSALSLASLSKALRVAGGGSATVHGFRSTFRDWAAERTDYPRDVAEMALAHTIGSKVEAAYRRGDLMTKRTAMMQEWAIFAATEPKTAEVIPIRVAA